MAFQIIFWISVLLILHSYLLFPLILKLLSRGKQAPTPVYSPEDDLPAVSFIIAVYNEESVLRKKIESIYQTHYPQQKIEVLIGSDASTDATNRILEEYADKYDSLRPWLFEQRQGKANILNELVPQAKGEILVMSDANVLFTPDTLHHLIKHYKNPQVSVVGGNILNTNLKNSGISYQEKFYLVNENRIKYLEGLIWGTMIGAFGGCYAIRKEDFVPVPRNYFMDDFYITLHALSKGKKALNELDAVCYEDISNILYEEFRRKVRISIGNYQNLSTYGYLLKKPFTGLGFCFLSHKVLRWFTPFFIMLALLGSAMLMGSSTLYLILFIAQLLLIALPFIDTILRKMQIHIVILRFVTHFFSMNLALVVGFFKYAKGVKTNVWQPTRRDQ